MIAALLLIALQQAPAATSENDALTPESYEYKPEGRRDPFISLLGAGETKLPAKRSDGLAGLAVGEISVRGVLQSRGAMLAMIQGPDSKTYLVRSGEKLLDGTIKSISAQGVVIVQDVSDPLSLIKQREIRKDLRSREDARQ
jgi:type IV pilus assembly protein PilP